MSRRIGPLPILAIIVLLCAPTLAADWNDGGSGDDAPGLQENARLLPGFGAYAGHLVEHDRDWYRVGNDSRAACVEARVSGAASAEAMLEVRGQDVRRIYAPWGPGTDAVVAIAAPSVADAYLLLDNVGAVDAGGYEFSLRRTTAGDVGADSGTSGDASGLRSQAVPVAEGCIGGRLGSQLAPDLMDVYSFQASAGDVAVLSLAGSAPEAGKVVVELLDPSGDVVTTLSTSAAEAVTLPDTGTYYISASSPTLSVEETLAYLVGLEVGPPGGGPCRPTCVSASGS